MDDMMKDPRELRKIMNDERRGARYHTDPLFTVFGYRLLSMVKMAAEAQGWSGEDEMTVLAFYLLKENKSLTDLNLELHTMNLSPCMIVKNEGEL